MRHEPEAGWDAGDEESENLMVAYDKQKRVCNAARRAYDDAEAALATAKDELDTANDELLEIELRLR